VDSAKQGKYLTYDWSVNFNPDVTSYLYDPITTATTSAQVSTVLCTQTQFDSTAPSKYYQISNYIGNSSMTTTFTSELGIDMSGVDIGSPN
jgi:hypothetical protein